ncbi:hypothetical protein SAMN05660209_02099 [Geodermatophilus africanus]|uniref:Uncharacterized protein n=1 Tax=Geodermatophilus africanus TaxID=1137993 RepID=A0A1H3HGZ8_9ACTN|nr:hypothetical protein SAMN05660209_02099 [Geodermatophilus africanus]
MSASARSATRDGGRALARAVTNPYLVPLYALVLAFLLGAGTSSLVDRPPRLAVTGPSPGAAPTSAATPPSFTAATDGRPTFSVTATDPAVRDHVLWTVLATVAEDPRTFAPVRPPASLSPAPVQSVDEPLVDRLLCITVPDGWEVAVPPGAPDLVAAATGVAAERTACQGGWSDPRAVPATLTFLTGRSR